jgi:putative proteasome-type protease
MDSNLAATARISAKGTDAVTYCVGMLLDRGLVLMSDTRTNSGVDNISTFRKMHYWCKPGERIIAAMTSGNLATTQSVISQLEERTKAPEERHNSLLEAPTMFQVATTVGKLLRETIQARDADNGETAAGQFSASMIIAGQIRGMEPRLFLIYPEGNFIEASFDTPFFQIGETKYGRPIILRGYDRTLSFENAVKLLMVSFDSTLKANLSVGMPLDMLVVARDTFEPLHAQRIIDTDPYFRQISSGWGEALKHALEELPPFTFAGEGKGAKTGARVAETHPHGHPHAHEKAAAAVK